MNIPDTGLNMTDGWHPCKYKDIELIHDGSWVSGRWYEWMTKDGDIEIARMKEDAVDHFWPRPGRIKEDDVIAFRELTT